MPEGSHGHAKSHGNDFVNHIGVQAKVYQQACSLGIGEEYPIYGKACAIPHHYWSLLDLGAELNGVEHYLFSSSAVRF